MELTIKLSRQDWELYFQHIVSGGVAITKKAKFWMEIMVMGGVALVTFLFLLFFHNIDWPTFSWCVLLIVIVICPRLYCGKLIRAAYCPSDDSSDFNIRSYTIDLTGVSYQAADTSCQYGWSNIMRIEESQDLICFMVGVSVVLIFPKSQLEDSEAFLVKVRAYHQQAQATLKTDS